MAGVVLLLHFGAFHLLSLGWRTVGVNAAPVMQTPLRSHSLAEFWGRRWNTAFHELATRFTFRPLRRMVGGPRATVLVFLLSGLIHELVISVPAHGGYGLPTGYFLLQGLGVAGERTRLGRRIGLARGTRGWLFTFAVAAAPAFWLFPPSFVRRVILPMLAFIGAT
jgi:D-alanyl-lipoteichoic acid acyltransferase DltB (MBOAT superfamily)